MNIMFVLTLCFGVLCAAIVIAASIFNTKTDAISQPAPWMRRVRQFQDGHANEGWRIHLIPYDDPNQPKVADFRGVVAIIPLAGVFGFIIGACVATYGKKHAGAGVLIAVSSLLLAFGGVWLKAHVEMQWDISPGRCVDRELRKILIPAVSGSSGGVWGWFCRVVCEYEYLCVPYRVTPDVSRMNFTSEADALKFLAERISPDGSCSLRVDPKNPLRTLLITQGIKNTMFD